MPENKQETEIQRMGRVSNVHAQLLVAIVQAAEHIVKAYIALTQPKKEDIVEAEVIPNEEVKK